MEAFLRAADYNQVFNDVSAIRRDEKFWPETGGVAFHVTHRR